MQENRLQLNWVNFITENSKCIHVPRWKGATKCNFGPISLWYPNSIMRSLLDNATTSDMKKRQLSTQSIRKNDDKTTSFPLMTTALHSRKTLLIKKCRVGKKWDMWKERMLQICGLQENQPIAGDNWMKQGQRVSFHKDFSSDLCSQSHRCLYEMFAWH